ncbi:MAG: family 78 glycoside hydrolase catalytic domain [Acidobacteria bacterium]|nr:family 78 glycoside hydrolase catalytic domain [Acidobacteriota bacterium]
MRTESGLKLVPLVAVALAVYGQGQTGQISVHGLRCEYLVNPLGIDVEKPRLSWVLNPVANVRAQSAYRVLVASSAALLQKDQGDLWDSGRVTSSQSTWVEYGGKRLSSGQQAFWKVRVWSDAGKAMPWSAQATWSMGLLQASDWQAKWIGEARPTGTAANTPLPFPWLRKTFHLTGKPRRAVAYVNPLGYYELYINGKKVDDHLLSPVVSDFSKRSIYVTHEIAGYLVPGNNVVALWLGRGWYVRGHPGVIHDGPLVRAQFEMTMDNESKSRVITDESWKLQESSLTPLGRATAFGDYGGERYAPSLDIPNWNAITLDDASWQAAAVFQPPQVPASAQMVEANRIVETLPAVRVDTYPQGGYVIDLGKNLTGWLDVKLPAFPKGTVVKLEYSDQMEPDKPAPPSPFGPGGERRGGRNPQAFPNTFNQRDEIAGNGNPVTFRSRFNYHAFRYVRVIGLDKPPAPADAKGYLIRTAYDRAGEFSSSNVLFNQIHKLVTRTYEALTLGGYVVDCPTRERLGYGGDAGTSFETGMFNFSVGGLYNSWLANWRDSQDASGSLPHTAPNYPNQGGGGPMWGGMVVTLPWQMYLQYGDRRVLETNYPMISKWLGYLASETQGDLLLDHKTHAMTMQMWNFLGDWLTPKGSFRNTNPDPTPAQLINSVHYLYQLQLASKIADVLGRKDEVTAFNARAAAVSKAIHARFYNPAESMYSNGDSVLQAFPLMTGVVPPQLRKAVMDKLENTILVRNQGHLDTGMHGTYFLMKYLWENGRNDLVFEMTNKKTYPGWGYMLANGATTAWEGWTGQSHIHDTLISIGAWFTEGLAGIQSDGKSPGLKHFLIKPAVVGDLTFVKAKYRSIHGNIASEWRIENGTFKWNVTVPPGTTATLFVPGEGPVRTKALPTAAGDRRFEVAPGTYAFETPLRQAASGGRQ